MIPKSHAAGYGFIAVIIAWLVGAHHGRDMSVMTDVRSLLTKQCQADYDRVLRNLEDQRGPDE